MRLKARRYLLHRRIPWLVLADPNDAAAAGDLESSPSAVDRVGDVHEP
jgi:hypothetical protein